MTPNQAISYERRNRAKEMLEEMMTTPDNTFIGRAQEASAQRKADNASGIWDPNGHQTYSCLLCSRSAAVRRTLSPLLNNS